MDLISEQRLSLVHPVLAAKIRAAAAELAAKGIYFRVASGLRTYAEQNVLWQRGRTAAGFKIPPDMPGAGTVTNAKGGYSNHNYGCAVDCYPFIHGNAGALDLNDPGAMEFVAMVAAIKAQGGIAWGGDWHSIDDEPHFQLANVPVTPTAADRNAFALGGLRAVWALYPQYSTTSNSATVNA